MNDTERNYYKAGLAVRAALKFYTEIEKDTRRSVSAGQLVRREMTLAESLYRDCAKEFNRLRKAFDSIAITCSKSDDRECPKVFAAHQKLSAAASKYAMADLAFDVAKHEYDLLVWSDFLPSQKRRSALARLIRAQQEYFEAQKLLAG